MPSITLEGRPISYALIRNPRRKRATVEVSADLQVTVKAPQDMPGAEVEDFLQSVSDWLLGHLAPEQAAVRDLRSVSDRHGTIEYRLVRNPRRQRITLRIYPDGTLEVRTPMETPEAQVEQLVLQKADWIRSHLEQAREAAPPPRQWVSGETLLFRGEPCTLEVRPLPPGARGRVEKTGRRLVVHAPLPPQEDEVARARLVRLTVCKWLSGQTVEEVRRRLPEVEGRLGVRTYRVRIKDMKTRWGSCGPDGRMSICFRIIMAPPEVMDYLLIHELCHITHPDHSREFWALVESFMPEHRRHRRWLRDNRAHLLPD